MPIEEKYSNWVGCMYHLPEQEFDYLEQTLKEYDVGGYIIAHEVTPYPHFHLVFEELVEKVYTNFNKKIVDKYKLRADSKKGIRKQYGKITTIKDIEKLKSYTIKDGNFRSNLSSDELHEVIERSFKKGKKKEWLDKCLEYIEEYKSLFSPFTDSYCRYHAVDERLAKQLIMFHIENEVVFTFNSIKSMVRYAIQKTKHLNKVTKADILWDIK